MYCALLRLELIFERFLGYLEMTFNESKFLVTIGILGKKKKKNAIKGETNSATAIQMVGRIAVFYLTITMRRTRD